MTRKEMLNAAEQIVCSDRNKQYGEPDDNFGTIAELWSAYCGMKFNAADVGIMMALFKIGRISTCTQKDDSYVDCAGYIACACEISTREDAEE